MDVIQCGVSSSYGWPSQEQIVHINIFGNIRLQSETLVVGYEGFVGGGGGGGGYRGKID